MYHYLVKETGTGKKRLIAASSPATAVAFCAKDAFTAQRCEGDVLEMVKETIKVETVSEPKPAAAEAPKDPSANK